MVGFLFWVALAVLAAAAVFLILVGVDQLSWIFGFNLAVIGISAFVALGLGMTWMSDRPEPTDTTPPGQCLVQQYQSVWEGKTEGHEWVCIGWANP